MRQAVFGQGGLAETAAFGARGFRWSRQISPAQKPKNRLRNISLRQVCYS
jgi:hypothetical protein